VPGEEQWPRAVDGKGLEQPVEAHLGESALRLWPVRPVQETRAVDDEIQVLTLRRDSVRRRGQAAFVGDIQLQHANGIALLGKACERGRRCRVPAGRPDPASLAAGRKPAHEGQADATTRPRNQRREWPAETLQQRRTG
jgi:hypothetical protein